MDTIDVSSVKKLDLLKTEKRKLQYLVLLMRALLSKALGGALITLKANKREVDFISSNSVVTESHFEISVHEDILKD